MPSYIGDLDVQYRKKVSVLESLPAGFSFWNAQLSNIHMAFLPFLK
jgi:hypothetical protein